MKSSADLLRDELLARTRVALAAQFDFSRPFAINNAAGSIDVMGGIATFTGSPFVRASLDLHAAAIAQLRLSDRDVQIFSFDEFDAHRPFTLRVPLDVLLAEDGTSLRASLNQPGRVWASAAIEAIHSLIEANRDLFRDPATRGFNIAQINRVPEHRGLRSSDAQFVAAQRAVSEVAPADRVPAGLPAHQGTIIDLPEGVRLIAIDSNSAGKSKAAQVRELEQRASSTHAIILGKMREFGRAANRELIDDPMNGQLSNLDPDDYKRFFRPSLSEAEQHVADHFVLEPRRVREFIRAIEQAALAPPRTRDAGRWLDRAGHLMYASDFSYRHDAKISSPENEFLVDAARAREKSGIYGARQTGDGAADGIVIVLADEGQYVDSALAQIDDDFHARFEKRISQLRLLSPVLGGAAG